MTELIKKVNDELSEIISAEIDFGADGMIDSNLTFSKDELAKIQNSLIRTEKYKWHKKPENGWTKETLPETWETIIFETSRECYIGEMRENKEFYSNADEYEWGFENDCVVAWRYYEPYEGSDEE